MKHKLRTEAKNIRKLIYSPGKDCKIIENLKKTKEYAVAKNILIYYPLKYEINTIHCLNDKTKNFYLPRVNQNELEICKFKEKELKTGSYNITEPCNEAEKDESVIDTVIIPAVAADVNGYRLGYGKGYYDKFLKNKKLTKIVLIYEKLIFPTIYPDKHDIKWDIAVSENYILNIR